MPATPRSADPRWEAADRDGVALACADYGGDGQTVMLLHGLAGCAEEWRDTASTLANQHRVVAPDQRGHGRSQRRPQDVSRDAYVADVEMWLERFEAAPAVLVGQSLGGHTAFLVAARRPDLVRALVVVEATPEANPRGAEAVSRWLASWPRPFASATHALRFFGGDSTWSRAWLRGLEVRTDGLWPRFDIDIMDATLKEASKTSYWSEWRTLSCPTLIVRGARGTALEEITRMKDLVPTAHATEIPDAGHDAHVDNPGRWQTELAAFLDRLDTSST